MRSEFFSERSVTEIDLSQIKKNYKIYKAHIGGKRVISVVKANAYGHGDVEVACALSEIGSDYFAVSNINEGIKLREGGISGNILILGYTPTSLSHLLRKYRLEQTVVSEEQLSELEDRGEKDIEYHLALNLGMNRIGLRTEDVEKTVSRIKRSYSLLKIKGIFTHFPVADSLDSGDFEYTRNAILRFDEICNSVRSLGIELFHCQNSAAGLIHPSSSSNATRLGISLYGYAPSRDISLPEGIKPVLSWKSAVLGVFYVKKGESVGYGRSFDADRNMMIATVSTGYADGYPRAASDKGFVLIKGERARIVGRICMDMMMVDVTDISDVKMGDTAVLIGSSRDEYINAEHIASCADTISYEILTGISSRVKRIYKEW